MSDLRKKERKGEKCRRTFEGQTRKKRKKMLQSFMIEREEKQRN